MALVDRRLWRDAGGVSVTLTIDLPSTSRTSPDGTRRSAPQTPPARVRYVLMRGRLWGHVFPSSLQRSVRPCFLVGRLSNVDDYMIHFVNVCCGYSAIECEPIVDRFGDHRMGARSSTVRGGSARNRSVACAPKATLNVSSRPSGVNVIASARGVNRGRRGPREAGQSTQENAGSGSGAHGDRLCGEGSPESRQLPRLPRSDRPELLHDADVAALGCRDEQHPKPAPAAKFIRTLDSWGV